MCVHALRALCAVCARCACAFMLVCVFCLCACIPREWSVCSWQPTSCVARNTYACTHTRSRSLPLRCSGDGFLLRALAHAAQRGRARRGLAAAEQRCRFGCPGPHHTRAHALTCFQAHARGRKRDDRRGRVWRGVRALLHAQGAFGAKGTLESTAPSEGRPTEVAGTVLVPARDASCGGAHGSGSEGQ